MTKRPMVMAWVVVLALLGGCYGHHGRHRPAATATIDGIARAYAANPVRADQRYDGLELTVTPITVSSIESGHAVAEGGIWVELEDDDLVRLSPGSVIAVRCDGGAKQRRGVVRLLDCKLPPSR